MDLTRIIKSKNVNNLRIALEFLEKMEIADKASLFDGHVWTECTTAPSEMLNDIIEFCIENDLWDSLKLKYPHLCRFAAYGTVEHLSILFNVGEIVEDTKCPAGYSYTGSTALQCAIKSKINVVDKLKFLFNNYEYSTTDLQNAVYDATKFYEPITQEFQRPVIKTLRVRLAKSIMADYESDFSESESSDDSDSECTCSDDSTASAQSSRDSDTEIDTRPISSITPHYSTLYCGGGILVTKPYHNDNKIVIWKSRKVGNNKTEWQMICTSTCNFSVQY